MAKVLIAEDERDIRDLIVFTLQFSGHDVTAAKDGAEAVELAKKSNFDIILMDVRMPRMTGYEACTQLKAIDRFKDVPIVFLSAKGQDTEVKHGLSIGADDYILKPFAPDQLTAQVKEILARYGKT